MRHELTELTATWLGDPTYGVNARLAGVTRKAGDAVPTDIANIAHEYADDFVVNDQDPPAVPALIVAVLEVELDWGAYGLPDPLDGMTRGAAIVVAYAARDALGASARRECAYALDAVTQSLRDLGGAAGNTTGGKRLRGVELLQVLKTQEVPLKKDLGRGSLAGAIVATCQVRQAA
jgi:hypothetical protein